MIKSLTIHCLLCLCLLLSVFKSFAQTNYTISGKITDVANKPIAGATIFIDGSEIETTTNNSGMYKLNVPGPGLYIISVKKIGYAGHSDNVMLKTKATNLDLSLAFESVLLDEVKIGVNKSWQSGFELFKTQFLGATPNAKACKIVNFEVLSFKMKKNLFTAQANDLLVIENPRLGYRIKYLLKYFRFTEKMIGTIIHTEASYDGKAIFEELPGTNDQKQEWLKNRTQAYKGSMIHFMRSVFSRTLVQQGFIVAQLSDGGTQYDDSKPVNFDTLETSRNASFVTFKSTGLHITYNPGGIKAQYQSYLLPDVKEITVDVRGRTSDGYIPAFLIKGDWSNYRLADQVPFEYSLNAGSSR